MLDYDGTLVAFSSDPQAVKPSERVLDLLTKLCANPRNEVVVISGRDRHTLETWLGTFADGPGGRAWSLGALLGRRVGDVAALGRAGSRS